MFPLLFLFIHIVSYASPVRGVTGQQWCSSEADCSYCSGYCSGVGWYCGQYVPCNYCFYWNTNTACPRNCLSECPMGKYRPDCYTCELSCPAGSYCAGSVTPTPCPSGTFMPDTGASVCIQCPNANTGQSVCTDCMPGSYKVTNNGTVSCPECPLYTYSTSYGSSACSDCLSNQYNTWTGQTYCMGCEAGKFIV